MEETHYRDKIGKNIKDGDELVVYYNPKNYKQSMVVKCSLKTSLIEFFSSMIILWLFYLGILKYEKDFDEEVSRKVTVTAFLVLCLFFLLLMTMEKLATSIWALVVLCWIIYVVFICVKMFVEIYF